MPIIRKKVSFSSVTKKVFLIEIPFFRLWEYGRPASQALQVLGEVGVTMRLEKEMKRYSPLIRSVVKAHGLQQRSNVIGQTFAVFRVDRIHHLLSVVSKVMSKHKVDFRLKSKPK